MFMLYLSYSYLILFPILTPWFAREIIKYQSISIVILFFALICTTLTIEFVNLMVDIDNSILTSIRIIILSIYIPILKNFGIANLSIKKKDEQVINLKEEFAVKKLNLNEKSILIQNLKLKIFKIQKVRSIVLIISAIIALITINIDLLILKTENKELRLVACFLLDFSAIIWFILFILHYKDIIKSNRLYYKIRTFIIPVSIIVTFMICILGDSTQKLFWSINGIIIIATLPISLIFLFTMNKKQKSETSIEILRNSIVDIKNN
jgi:hypothetical protein